MIKRIKLFLYFFQENKKFDVVTSPVRIWTRTTLLKWMENELRYYVYE